MKAGLLIIASEVLEGKITDLNTKSLALFLRENNLKFHRSMTVRDEISEIQGALDLLYKTCDLVMTSGGLGPTRDDLTKEALASYFDKTIEYSETAEIVARGNYQRFNREFQGREHGYSFLPRDFVALSNSTGFAPALLFHDGNKAVFAGPGVPREFNSLLKDHVLPWIKEYVKRDSCFENVIVRTKRIPEEKIFKEVDPSLWNKLEAFGEVSSLPTVMGVDIGVRISARSSEDLAKKRDEVNLVLRTSPIATAIWNWGPQSLEEVIVKKAETKKLTFGFAESCTGGLCSHRITNVSGSSQVFMGSVISYDNAVKTGVIDVSSKTINTFGVVSSETAAEMAIGLQNRLQLSLAISTTGIAGPTGGTEKTPVGTVCIGVCVLGKVECFEYKLFGDREQLKERFTQAALFHLLEAVEKFA